MRAASFAGLPRYRAWRPPRAPRILLDLIPFSGLLLQLVVSFSFASVNRSIKAS
jgi:hypothetical protein